MQHRWLVAFAVIASLLVVASLPATAADANLEVASQFTTNSDFSNADTLNGVSVSDNAVSFNGAAITDSFEDQTLTDDWSGDTGSFSHTTGNVTDGSYAITASGSGLHEITSTSGLPDYPNQGENYLVDIFTSGGGGYYSFKFGYQDSNNYYRVRVSPSNNDIILQKVSGGSFNTLDSTAATIGDGVDLTINLDWTTSGEITATVSDNGGTIGTVSATDTTYSSGGIAIIHDGADASDSTTWDFIRKKVNNGQYVSANHSASAVEAVAANLSLTSAEATVEAQYWDGSAWQVANSSTFTSSGNKTLSISGVTATRWRTNVTFRKTGSSPNAGLEDETFLFQAQDPTTDDAKASSNVAGDQVTLSIPVDDPDFSGNGDSLTVDFSVNGNSVGSDTLSSAGTASVTTTQSTGGENTWSVVVTDSYGESTSSETFTFEYPLTIYVHDGNNTSALIDDRNISMEVLATSDTSDFRVEKNITNGKTVLSGMPDEQLAIYLNASGYAPRAVIVENPYAKVNRRTVMYSLNDSKQYEQCFELDSRGAGFAPDRSWLIVQSYINGSWRDAAGGYFGAANLVCMNLEDDEQYRLVVEDDENRRSLGGYEADKSFTDQVIPLIVEGQTFGLDRGKIWQVEVKGEYNETDQTGSVVFQWASNDAHIEDLHLTVHEEGKPGTPIFEDTDYDVVSTAAWSVPLDANQTEKTWVITWDATHFTDNGTEQISGQTRLNVRTGSELDIGLDPQWEAVIGGGLIILVGGVFGLVHAPVGALVTAVLGSFLTLGGYLDIPELAVSLAIAVGVLSVVAAYGGNA